MSRLRRWHSVVISSPSDSAPEHNSFKQSLNDSAQLEQLAAALTHRGYDATLITPAPYLAVRIPGATLPQMIYNSGGHFWWHTAQTIGPATQTSVAVEVITWALRAFRRDPPTHDATSPLTPRSLAQEC
jgi:hypothetical protein